jgi:hypothetical protein
MNCTPNPVPAVLLRLEPSSLVYFQRIKEAPNSHMLRLEKSFLSRGPGSVEVPAWSVGFGEASNRHSFFIINLYPASKLPEGTLGGKRLFA